uniref:Essential MCU regulator, mitochondrial n=1 Tax=Thelazia callipaeda TaxID=103827 RepID=A0A0N5D684_THECL
LWDDRYNKPRLFLFGENRRKVYEIHDKLSVPLFKRSCYGMYLEVMYRLSLGVAALIIGCSLYVMLIPEEVRLKYKHRLKHLKNEEHP